MIEYNYMKNNKGMTLIELIVSIVLLSVILIFLHTLVNNLAFNEMDKNYDDNVMRDLLVDNVQENLIHFGLAYNEEEPIPVILSDDKTMITINTLVGKSIILVNKEENDLYEIVYNDAYGKNAIWGLSEDLEVDIENISIKLGDNNNKGNTYLKIVIPVYEKDKESKDNNYTYNDFIINYYGKNNLNTGKYIDPDIPEEDTEKEIPLSDYLIKNGNMWQSGLEGDGYRFVGTGAYNTSTTPSNFVCFGTIDQETCKSNPDKYMYRIIGVFDNYTKLIKLTSLSSNAAFTAGTRFGQGILSFGPNVLSNRLNGNSPSATSMPNLFIGNQTYDYLGESSAWLAAISEEGKRDVVTLTLEGGPNYYNSLSPSQIYLHEMNRTGKTTTTGQWHDNTLKIVAMNVSDYVLSLGDTAKSMTTGTYSNQSALRTSWLFLGNNKYGNTTGNYNTEHTTASYGLGTSSATTNYSWTINPNGYITNTNVTTDYGIRPVFYLDSKVTRKTGTGTLADPYMITP